MPQTTEQWECLFCKEPQITFENMLIHVLNEHLNILKSMESVFSSFIKRLYKSIEKLSKDTEARIKELTEQLAEQYGFLS